MFLLLATLTGVFQAAFAIGGAVHGASRGPSSPLKTPRQGKATASPSWLLIPRTLISREPDRSPAISSPQLKPTRFTSKGGGRRLSSGLSKAHVDSLGFVRSLSAESNALRSHRGPIGADNIPDANTGGTGEATAKDEIACPRSKVEKRSTSEESSDAFGCFNVSPRAVRSQPDVQRLAALCRSLAIAAPVNS